MKQKLILMSTVVLSSIGCVIGDAANFALVKDGEPVSNIVVKADAPKPVKHGADELSTFLAKISGGEAVKVANAPETSKYNVFIGTKEDEDLLNASGLDAAKIKPEGFVIAANKDGLFIIGGDPLGALYGCYEVLKKYGGIRWLTPLPDGEYFTERKTIEVPEQVTYRNPRLAIRRNAGASMEWATRNYLQPYGSTRLYAKPETAERAENNACVTSYTRGHIMTWLLAGGHWRNTKEGRANLEKLFKEHPDCFPLVNGKRTLEGWVNPCVSNPRTLDIMAETLIPLTLLPHGNDEYITIGNNDTTAWCECENCRKLDNPAMKGTKGQRSDRYWHTVNEIAKRVWKVNPKAKIRGWAYQDFWYPPTKVKIDPRIPVLISFNNQCWRHAITDPKCSVNAQMLDIYNAWKKLNLPLVYNRDEICASGSVGNCYYPSERVLYQNCKDYPSIGCNGTRFCTRNPSKPFLNWAKNRQYFYGKNYSWHAMWQTNYLTAQFLFDIDQDFDELYEECNRLYYGKAWEGGMKEFKALQTKAFYDTPGCCGWGQNAPLGRCLDQPGLENKLKTLLDQAEAAAKTDPDPRALKHVQMDKKIFNLTWVTARKNYLENYKELDAYHKTAPVKIDGLLDEPDWKEANVLTNFKIVPWKQKKGEDNLAETQTSARAFYDQDNLYVAVECEEPDADKLKHAKSDRDAWPSGNKVEVFFNYPDMADKYYHYAIGSDGGFYDALASPAGGDKTYDGQAEYAVKRLPDRWIVEMRFPTNAIGMKCFEGATWKLNVARQRELTDGTKEQSSCSNGAFHGAGNFVNVKLASGKTP